jgi:hypothetical protein
MSTTGKATMWEPWTVVHECILGPPFEVDGEDETFVAVDDGMGNEFATVPESQYPDGTTFTVEVTITPRHPFHDEVKQ